MRRRILLAILATVALSLVLAGTGSYLLLRRQAVQGTAAALRDEAEAVVTLVGTNRAAAVASINRTKVVEGLRVEGISVLVRAPDGRVRGELPPGITEADVPPSVLDATETLGGRRRDLLWAAASLQGRNGGAVTVVLTRSADPPRPPMGWFLLAGGLALAAGAAVAWWLSDGLTRPLRRAQEATVRIAAGDLASPLPEPSPTDDDEVAGLTRSINAMAVSLDHARGAQRRFLLSVSHDLRTPLTSIQGYAEAIAEGADVDPAEAARTIGTEAQRLGRLVGDLLDLARLDASEFSLHLAVVPVDEVVVEAVEGFRPTAEAAGLALHLGATPTPLPARVDPDRLAQVLANLVENAAKFAAGAVWVDVTATPEGGVAIAVLDDGPGIAPADLPRIFERLHVTDRRPRRQVGGSGLGLAIVHELVAAMGGTVRADSPAVGDQGARLTVTLPRP